jgi:dienelactone hydrolase
MARRMNVSAVFRCAAVAFAAVINLRAAATDPSNTFPVFSERAVGIDVHWRAAPGEGRRPAIIALHGCSGLYTPSGKAFDARYLEYTAHPFDVIVYPDSHHGFDGTRPVRLRPAVADGKGAHAGGNPAARDASRKVLMEFLTKVLQ